jgi:hypothetical protein
VEVCDSEASLEALLAIIADCYQECVPSISRFLRTQASVFTSALASLWSMDRQEGGDEADNV